MIGRPELQFGPFCDINNKQRNYIGHKMLKFLSWLNEEALYEAKSGESYNDEHALVNVWNYMVSKGIAHDKKKMTAELDKAKTDKKHPLHFNKAGDEGFTGGKKTSAAKASYHDEHETAMHTVHALANHPDFKKAIAEKHTATVMGGAKGDVTDTWKKHGATKGATSKADITIHKGDISDHRGLKLSMK